MNTVAIGLFHSQDLKSLHSNFLLSPEALRHRVLRAYATFRKTGSRQFYDDNGFLATVDDIKTFAVVILTSDDLFPFNRATHSRVAKLLRDCEDELPFEVLANLDALIAAGLYQKDILDNHNKHPTETAAQVDAHQSADPLVDILDPAPLEGANLKFIFQNLKFDFLKDDPMDPLVLQMREESERTMKKGQFDQFMVNLDSWDRGEKAQEPIRISLAPEKPKNSMQILMRNSALASTEGRSKPQLTVEEQLRIQVRETEIVEIQIRGRLLLANSVKGQVLAVEVGNDAWNNEGLVKKSRPVATSAVTIQESPGNLRITPADIRPGQILGLLEYTLNPKVLTDETIPVYFAYNQVRNQLVLQVKINPSFAQKIPKLRVKVICSHSLEEGTVRSSHIGACVDNAFVMTLDRSLLAAETIQIKMQLQEPGIAFLRVAAECQVSRCLVDFEMRPRQDPELTPLTVESRLTIDYTLVL